MMKLIYIMTDNCQTMRGSKSGFTTRMKDHCPNLIDVSGCACHQTNLLQRDETKHAKVREIIQFAEKLSHFLESKPKVVSMLHQCEKMLGLTRINQYCPTRFLSLYSVLDEVCHQFPIIQKIVAISNRQDLLTVMTSDTFLIHLDQFVIHVAPVYAFLKGTQSQKMNIYDCLKAILELIGKLLMRLGHVVSLCPKSYYKKLYADGKPIYFKSKNSNIHVSVENAGVNAAMERLSDDEFKTIKMMWDSFNEDQLHRLLERFSDFLCSPLIHYCYTLFIDSSEFTDSTLSNFKRLASFLSCNKLNAVDEFSTLRCNSESTFRLAEIYCSGGLTDYKHLSQIVEYVLLVVPHNMVVEAGFSKMKLTESQYQTNLDSRTYDSLRAISDYFDRQTFEEYDPPPSLLSRMSKACSCYKEEKAEQKKATQQGEEQSGRLQRTVGVYKRRKSSVVSSELLSLEKQLTEAQEAVAVIQAKKAKLETEKSFALEREDNLSLKIVNSMFK